MSVHILTSQLPLPDLGISFRSAAISWPAVMAVTRESALISLLTRVNEKKCPKDMAYGLSVRTPTGLLRQFSSD